ncbi:heavy-metal-associated domain-containing protein [Lacunimicrobium album]
MKTLKLKTNLRCAACVKSIQPLFDAEPGIERWDADVSTPDKVLTVQGVEVTAARVGELLRQKGYEVAGEVSADTPAPSAGTQPADEPKTSYYPLVLILLYLLGAVGLAEVAAGGLDTERAMRNFMAGFFLVFSFFKLLDVPAFAMSYSSYDILARRWLGYGYVYPFVELALGAAYLANFQPAFTNTATLVVMGVSTVGVVQSLLARRKIRCACLGAVFNLPMSYVTLTEDLLMAGMAAAMLAMIAGTK